MFDFLKKIMGGGDSAELKEWIEKGAVILDVRTPQEFQAGHPKGAINIPVDEVTARVNEFGDKSNPVIVYCASGARSAYAARILKMSGYQDVVNAGGLYDMPDYQ